MNSWALLSDGHIVNVVCTSKSLAEVKKNYKDYDVEDLYSLPKAVVEEYEFYSERP